MGGVVDTADTIRNTARRPRKRERYTRIACESCKSRKVKCSGILPCSRCSELNVECTYNDYVPQPQFSDSAALKIGEEPRSSTTDATPPDLNQLLATLKQTCDQIQLTTSHYAVAPPPNPPLARRRQRSEDAEFKDITSPSNFVHSLNLARSVLEQRGVLSIPVDHITPDGSESKDAAQSQHTATAMLRATRPILDIGYEGVLHYLTTFKLEIYTIYPCINLGFAKQRIDLMFRLPSVSSKGKVEEVELDLIDVEITKAVLAIAMLIEGKESPLSSDMKSRLVWSTDQSMNQETAQVEDVIMASLLAIYFILKDEAVKAWRMAGIASKSCIELGMHNNSFYEGRSPSLDQSAFLGTLFCCVYDLDKRCSFFTNLPWTLHDKSIDQSVLNIGPRHPFLSAMVALNRIHAEIIELINSSSTEKKESDERAEYLDFRVQKLVEGIPQTGFFPPESAVVHQSSRQMALKALFQLRTNHIRMLTHIPSLSSAQALACRPRSARTLISLARSTVELHTATIMVDGVSRFIRPIFDKILMGSVSCMFLAASYDPGEYGPMCSNDFHSALDTLSQCDFSLSGLKSKIWCTLEDLRSIGQSIQMPTPEQSPAVATSAEGYSTCLGDMQQQFAAGDFLGSFKGPDHDLLAAVFGDSHQGASDSSIMSSYMYSAYDEPALPLTSWYE